MLQLISLKMVIIPKDMIMTGTASALNTLVRTKVKIEFCGVSDANVYCGSSWDVARATRLLFFVRAKQPGVVALLNDNKRDAWFVISFEFDASFTQSSQFVLQNLKNK